MQLVAVDDIGRFVAAILADPRRFAGQTVKLASDAVTGLDMAAAFTRATGRAITYARFPEETLAAKQDLRHMMESLDHGPLYWPADLDLMRKINPTIMSLGAWLARRGATSRLSRDDPVYAKGARTALIPYPGPDHIGGRRTTTTWAL